MKWWKNILSCGLQSNKYGTQLYTQLAARRVYDINKHYTVLLLRKTFPHTVEWLGKKNNIHPNNKQKPKIANKNTGKIACQYGQLVWVWKMLRNLRRDFHQVRNQLGTPEGRRVFWKGPKFFKLCPIVFNCVQHIFPLGAKYFLGGLRPPAPPLVVGLIFNCIFRCSA